MYYNTCKEQINNILRKKEVSTMEKKMTQKEMFNQIIALAAENGRSDIVEFAKGRIAVLDKKSENRSQTKTQKENENLKVLILKVLSNAKVGMTITEIQNKDEVLGSLNNQKVSAVTRMLVKDGKVIRDDSGKKTLFSIKRG